MTELNTKTSDLDYLHGNKPVALKQLLTASLPRKKLLPLVDERVKSAIVQFIECAPISTSGGDVMASANVVDYLRGASAIPLEPELCTLMARVGFDKDLFTYGIADGHPVGYAEGLWLLKFFGFKDKGRQVRHQNALRSHSVERMQMSIADHCR